MSSRGSSTSPGINFKDVVINPANLKCASLPLFSLRNPYSATFHLAWLGYFVAFLSWFAFSPLIPGAIKQDLNLTPDQVRNSNVVSLCATLLVRVGCGTLVDRFGPRKVMAALLIIGAIPSGLAGTAHTATGLYIIRFFIGVLGGTFVTCQAWTTAFFDKSVIGTATALTGGWGNTGGGFTFVIMISLYNALVSGGLKVHDAWRAAFVIVPVPFLLMAATAILIFGTDHPAGKWSDRYKAVNREVGASDNENELEKKESPVDIQVTVVEAHGDPKAVVSELDTAVSDALTWRIALKVMSTPLTWLPAFAYLTTLGYELAMNANLSNVLLTLYKSPTFGQTKAGYIAATYGFMNIFARPLGGYMSDLMYRRWGVPGKKYLMIFLGITEGIVGITLGWYIDNHHNPSLEVVIILIVFLATACEASNGVNFSLVPHCNPRSNGFMSGIVGAMGNLGGILFALVFRLQPLPLGKPFWICGIIALGVNSLLVLIRVPRV